MKRIISILLFVVFISMLCIPSFASNNTLDQTNQFLLPENQESETIITTEMIESIITLQDNYSEVYQQVLNDFSDLRNALIDTNNCTPSKILDNGKILYDITFPIGIVDQVTVERDEENILTVNYYEGSFHNEVKFLPNGNLLVDGTEVRIDTYCNGERAVTMNSTITPPLRMRNLDYSLTPWGSPSDYTIYRGVYSGNSCSWGVSTLVGLAVGTVATIICSYVNASLGLSIYVNIFSGVASSMITHCNIYGMDDAYFSWRFYKRERVDSMSIDRYFKYSGACYSRANLTGTVFSHVYYVHDYFS